ncbi:MAG: hypothetical protein Kow0069_01940 [Promethearchaeota archaeon]
MASASGQPLWLKLPCIKCGSEIPELIEGTTIKCMSCGTTNSYLESKEHLERHATEVFGRPPSIEFIEDPNIRAETRIMRENKLGELFSTLEGEHLEKMGKSAVVATPLERYPHSKEEVLDLAVRYNMVGILLKNYVLPLSLTADESRPGLTVYYFTSCRGQMILGTYHTIVAALSKDNDTAWTVYTLAGRNFQRMAELAKEALGEEIADDRFNTFYTLGDAYANYAVGLSSISKGNPEWATRQLSRVRELLKEVVNAGTDPRAKIDHVQAGMIVAFQPTIETIFGEMKEGKRLKEAMAVKSLPVDAAEEIISTLRAAREGLQKTTDRFKGMIDFFIKLNFGVELEYVTRYKQTFAQLIQEQKVKFDEILRGTIKSLIRDYKFRCREVFRRMELIANAAKLPGESTKEQIKEEREELNMLERTLEPTLSTILSLAYGVIKKDQFLAEIKPFLDESHRTFDKWVRAAILNLISDYRTSADDIASALNAMIDTAKLDSGIATQFVEGRRDLDSLSFAISEIVDLSYAVRRGEFAKQIQIAQSKQRVIFDRMVRKGILHLIKDYDFKNKAIIKGMEPVIQAAKMLGDAAVEEVVQGRADLTTLDALFDSTIGTMLNASYEVKRGEFTEEISTVQAYRKRDFSDQVRRATRTLLDYAGRSRRTLFDERSRVVKLAETAMLRGNYKKAASLYEVAARISSELGEPEKAQELNERARAMARLVF